MVTLEELQEAAQIFGTDVVDKVTAYAESLGIAKLKTMDAMDVFRQMGIVASSLSPEFSKATEGINKFVASMGGPLGVVSTVLGGIAKSAEEMEAALEANPEAADKITDSLLTLDNALGFLPKGTDLFGKLAEEGSAAGNTLQDTFNTLGMKSPVFQNFAMMADGARQTEQGLIRLMATTGRWDEINGRTRRGLDDLSSMQSKYTQYVYETADATGLTQKQATQFVDVYGMKIPDAMERTVLIGGKVNQNMTEAAAALKIGTAYGLTHEEVIEQMGFAFEKLGLKGEGALSFMARMNTLADEVGGSLKTAREIVTSVADTFKMFGDNAQAAINIVQALGPALRDSGMGPEAIQKLVASMTGGIKEMDIAHKAFVAGMSGGPGGGGLAGGFQIDYMIQQGNLDDALRMTMESMQKQFGGPVVTLEDVNRTPALAGELLKQVSFLKDVAGLASNNEEAYKILDAMKSGGTQQLKEVRDTFESDKDKEMIDAISTGNDQQAKQTTQLTLIANYLEMMARIQGMANKEKLEDLAGFNIDDLIRKTTARSAGHVKEALTFEGLKEQVLPNAAGALGENARDLQNKVQGLAGGEQQNEVMSYFNKLNKNDQMSEDDKSVAFQNYLRDMAEKSFQNAAGSVEPEEKGEEAGGFMGGSNPPVVGEARGNVGGPMRSEVVEPTAGDVGGPMRSETAGSRRGPPTAEEIEGRGPLAARGGVAPEVALKAGTKMDITIRDNAGNKIGEGTGTVRNEGSGGFTGVSNENA